VAGSSERVKKLPVPLGGNNFDQLKDTCFQVSVAVGLSLGYVAAQSGL
jgi:hypothetical protein